MCRFFFIFGLLLNFSALSLPSFIEQPPLVTAKEVLDWVNPEKAKPIKSVEELLSRLPEAYRTYFVLQYKSHSNHLSDSLHPRVIFFGADARLLLAFSGLPSDPQYDTIEMIEYEPLKAGYSFYSIHFSPDEETTVEINPQDCQRCHGSNPKPNWEPYSLWPGAYGSLHDAIFEGSQEHRSFSEFLKSSPLSKRYQYLPRPFHVESTDSLGKTHFFLNNAGVGPGSSLSLLLSALNQDRIAKLLVTSPSHLRYRPAITAAILGCEEPISDFLPIDLRVDHPTEFSEVLLETKAWMERDLERKIKVLVRDLQISRNSVLKEANLFGFRDSEVIRIAKLRFLLQKRKNPIEFDRWALSISKTSLDFNDGLTGLENLIGHYLALAYNDEDSIRRKIKLTGLPFSFTSFNPTPQSHHMGDKDPQAYRIPTYSLLTPPAEVCGLLLKEAQALSLSQ